MCIKCIAMPLFLIQYLLWVINSFLRNYQEAFSWACPSIDFFFLSFFLSSFLPSFLPSFFSFFLSGFSLKKKKQQFSKIYLIYGLVSLVYFTKEKNKILLFALVKICLTHLYIAFWYSAVTISVNNKDKTKKQPSVLRFPEWWSVLRFFNNRLKVVSRALEKWFLANGVFLITLNF